MEFKKERVYSAVNADELKPGDKVIVADDLDTLKRCVIGDDQVDILTKIGDETHTYRFFVMGETNDIMFLLAYLVERAENCTNCIHYTEVCLDCLKGKDHKCYKYETEQKAEKHTDYNHCEEAKKAYDHAMTNACSNKRYRPFKDTDELIKAWIAKRMITYPDLCLPHIWVRFKDCQIRDLITGFGRAGVQINAELVDWYELYNEYEFLDGSVCGVEE